MKQVFDYGNIKKEHQDAAKEIINILEETGNEMIAILISKKFQIIPTKKYEIQKSNAIKFFKENNLQYSIQGYTTENDIEYQWINISADIRKFEDIISKIKNENNKISK